MATAAQIVLPVSLGEALDKLTILDIKLKKITDARRADVQTEYDALYSSLKDYVAEHFYYYRILRDINQTLWDIQDEFHGKDLAPERAAEIARLILLENDRRFRVKLKINRAANSALKEQKGYALKKALIYTHLGLGDMIWMNGAVRYLSTEYDEVYVVCKEKYRRNAEAMYADDSSIKLFLIHDDVDLAPWQMKRELFQKQGFTVFGSGFFAPTYGGIRNLPVSFYEDLKLDPLIRFTYFHVPRTAEAKALRSLYADRPYIVVHQQSSVQTLEIVKTLRAAGEQRLILDLNENPYAPADPDYELAQHTVNKPILDYTDLLEGAEELHMIESSLYCLANHMDLSHVKRRVCYEPWGGNAERLGLFETGKTPEKRLSK